MTRATRIELIAIAAAVMAAYALAPWLPRHPALGEVVLAAAVLLLAQGLLRDLVRLLATRRAPAARREMRCVCAESVVGVGVVAAGLGALGAGLDAPLAMDGWRWAAVVVAAAGTGLALRDVVIGWRPLSVRREPDHDGIVVRWRR